MSLDNRLEKHFDYGSFLPLVLFILGIYECLLFITQSYSQGILIMLFAFILYVINNLIVNYNEKNLSVFNQYLDEIAVFITFGLAPIIFGLNFYKQDFIILLVVFFYSICQILNFARNFVLNAKNSRGWPAPLNGIFFPFTFYIYMFYLQGPGHSIFIVYFILIAVLSVSEYNFLGYEREELAVIEKQIGTEIESELKSISKMEEELNKTAIINEKKQSEKNFKENKETLKKESASENKLYDEKKKRLEEEKKILEEIENLKSKNLY